MVTSRKSYTISKLWLWVLDIGKHAHGFPLYTMKMYIDLRGFSVRLITSQLPGGGDMSQWHSQTMVVVFLSLNTALHGCT